MENKEEERLFENEIVAIIEKGKACSRYAENFDTRENAYLDGIRFGAYSVLEQYHQPPTPAVDELNLDERVEDATAEQLRDWLTICKKSRNWNRAELLKAQQNHASFVALVEGEIAVQESGNSTDNEYTVDVLRYLLKRLNLLTKIKK